MYLYEIFSIDTLVSYVFSRDFVIGMTWCNEYGGERAVNRTRSSRSLRHLSGPKRMFRVVGGKTGDQSDALQSGPYQRVGGTGISGEPAPLTTTPSCPPHSLHHVILMTKSRQRTPPTSFIHSH